MTILAAIGGEHEQDHVVEIGHELAEAFGDDLVVLHVMAQEQFEELRGETDISTPVVVAGADEDSGLVYVPSDRESEYNVEIAEEDARGVAQEVVSRTIPDQSDEEVTTVGRVGDPAKQIADEAGRLDARYIVVGGRKRSPVGKAVFGSVAQRVILDSDRPVVAITR